MKFINNKTILSIYMMVVLCLVFMSSPSLANVEVTSASSVAVEEEEGAVYGDGGVAAIVPSGLRGGAAQNKRRLPGSCRTYRHKYLTYCQTTCMQYINTASCIMMHPSCKGCI